MAMPMTPAPEPRNVYDTNILISTLFFTDSMPGRAFAVAHDHGEIRQVHL
jgi:hypothetical protein